MFIIRHWCAFCSYGQLCLALTRCLALVVLKSDHCAIMHIRAVGILGFVNFSIVHVRLPSLLRNVRQAVSALATFPSH